MATSWNRFIRYKRLFTLLLLAGLLLCLVLLIRSIEIFKINDFIEYWSAIRSILHGGNAYNPTELLLIQKQVGYTNSQPLMMYNPPWTLTLLLFLGLFDPPSGQLVWLILNITLIFFCVIKLWKIYAGQSTQYLLPLLYAFSFVSTILALVLGQITPFILFGLVYFVMIISNPKYDILAGFCLILISIKPQLTIIFWFALLLWIINQRRWLILVSFVVLLIILSGIISLFNPQIIPQYIEMLQSHQIGVWENPTIGSYLRFFSLMNETFWVHFVPTVIGGIWFVYYWSKKYKNWKWADEIPILLLVSMVVTPFAWTYDYVILLPVIILAVSWLINDFNLRSIRIYTILFLMVNFFILILHTRVSDIWFFWMAPLMLLMYLIFSNYHIKIKKSQTNCVLDNQLNI